MSIAVMSHHKHWAHVPYSPHNRQSKINQVLSDLVGKPAELVDQWHEASEGNPEAGIAKGDLVVTFKAKEGVQPEIKIITHDKVEAALR